MSIDEYYKKRLIYGEYEVLDYAKSIYERFNRMPRPDEFWEEYRYFVTMNQIDDYPLLKKKLGAHYMGNINGHVAKYQTFNEFLKAAGIEK